MQSPSSSAVHAILHNLCWQQCPAYDICAVQLSLDPTHSIPASSHSSGWCCAAGLPPHSPAASRRSSRHAHSAPPPSKVRAWDRAVQLCCFERTSRDGGVSDPTSCCLEGKALEMRPLRAHLAHQNRLLLNNVDNAESVAPLVGNKQAPIRDVLKVLEHHKAGTSVTALRVKAASFALCLTAGLQGGHSTFPGTS